MTSPIRFYSVPRELIEPVADIPTRFIDDYLRLRPGILDTESVDVFCPNHRSDRQRWTAFELFERTNAPLPGDAVVCMSWLELCEASGAQGGIDRLMQFLRDAYPECTKIISWNHDRDARTVRQFDGLGKDWLVLNYNTSYVRPADLVLPFWNVYAKANWGVTANRMVRGSFLGTVCKGTKARVDVLRAFHGKPGWEVMDVKVPENEYIGLMCESDFALCPRGGGLSSYRFFEAIQCGAIPVLFADDVVLPYPDLAWNEFIVRIPERFAGDFSYVNDLLSRVDVCKFRAKLAQVRERFSLAGVHREIHKRLSVTK